MTEDKIEGFFTGERTMTDFCEGVNIYSDLVRKLIWDEICSTFDYMDSFLNEIKSPIEQALYLAVKNGGCLDSLDRYSKHGFGRESVVFDYQYKIKLESKNYILDFLLAIWLQDDTTLNFAIECDGHDFH